MTDQELIAACRKNDRRSQNELYRRYFPLMSSIALRYTRDKDEAVHALNAAFLKVLQNLDRYNGLYAPATFIRTVLVNHLIDEYRRRKNHQNHQELETISETEHMVTYNTAEHDLEADELLAMLGRLPELTRNVFNLYAIDGYRHQEIAGMLGIPEGTSKWHVSEARRKLKDMLDEVKKKEKKNTRKIATSSYESGKRTG